MKRFLEEPLLHFLLLGATIFAAYALINRGIGDDRGEIVVTQGQIASMTEGYIRTRQRAPTSEEWERLLRDRVQEEVYYREALALGLDKDDLIIRRRLQQKMQFVSEGLAAPAEPSDAQLQSYLDAHVATFATERRFSFRQVYLDPQRHGGNLARDTERLRVGLNLAGARASLAHRGDAIVLEHEFDNASARDVANTFGQKFADALGSLTPGEWQGPVESGYGAHVVILVERKEGGVPALGEVREAVRREWANAEQREAAREFYQQLLGKYVVTIERSPAAGNAPDPVALR